MKYTAEPQRNFSYYDWPSDGYTLPTTEKGVANMAAWRHATAWLLRLWRKQAQVGSRAGPKTVAPGTLWLTMETEDDRNYIFLQKDKRRKRGRTKT